MTAPVAEHLRLADFDYDLPVAQIAQEPSLKRDGSRLMTLDRRSALIGHRTFTDIEHYLAPGDLLVLNDTKVLPCRLAATGPGGGKAELFLLAEQERNLWTALVKGGGRPGKRLTLPSGAVAEIIREEADGARAVRFHNIADIRDALGTIGQIPLPPYINRAPTESDRERYQTVYAAREGAVAAPTAGLHFSSDLLGRLRQRGVEFVTLTLHVGPGTFQPVRVDRIIDHRMPQERFVIAKEAAEAINRAKSQGRRVIAVGTTSVRTLETANRGGMVMPGEGMSDLFIYPGYKFNVTEGMITNFHLPKSTLLMLVSAFAGREAVLAAYRTAVTEGYRFYSYGDAMLIL